METSPGSEYPRVCIEVGLTCEACTEETASQLAQVCKGLRGKMVGQMFVQIYPNSACSRMHSHFAGAYRAASREVQCASPAIFEPMEAVEIPAPPRRGPVPERRRVMVAVA